ncbi:hypothetical protein V6Z12_A03G220500 [Gossypium hirsutum]
MWSIHPTERAIFICQGTISSRNQEGIYFLGHQTGILEGGFCVHEMDKVFSHMVGASL